MKRERWSDEFPPEAMAVRAARRFVVESAAATGVDLGLLELAVSELAANAVLHARTPFVVTFERLADGIRVEVSDRSEATPGPAPTDPTAITGRGLKILASVCRRWGTEPTPAGKTVWFEMGWTQA